MLGHVLCPRRWLTPAMTSLVIDPNIRVRGNQTLAAVEDASSLPAVGGKVQVVEQETGAVGDGTVTDVDRLKGLIFISVDWPTLRPR